MQIGYKDDFIFLLSIEEYEHYKDVFPSYLKDKWTWLRSPGDDKRHAALVWKNRKNNQMAILKNGEYSKVAEENPIIPAIKYSALKSEISMRDEETGEISFRDWQFIIIDPENEVAICKQAIVMSEFDKWDNDYETSHARKWLLRWAETGQVTLYSPLDLL